MHAHEGANLGRRRKNARTVCYRLFPGKMGRDAGDPCRGDGNRDPTLCLKTVVSTRGRLLCSLPPPPLAPSHPAAIRALERNFTPCRFRIRKNIRFSLISSIYFLSFNDIVTNRRNLLPDNYSSNNLKGRAIRSPRDLSPSKQEWIGYYRESVYNSRYASTWPVNRPIKWSCKSSLLTLT